MSRQTERIGRSGEFLTASVLSLISDTVSVTPHGSHADVLFEWENKIYKCQVKTKSKIGTHDRGWRFDFRRGSHTKNRNYDKGSIDVYALVSLEHQTICFYPFSCAKTQTTISDQTMKNLCSLDSFETAMGEIKTATV
tara:strand:- start:4265 stop:4678 length:414 start_codon:yes stop_codon:yes gene_type:complete